MQASVTTAPGGISGLEEFSVRGKLQARLLIRADGTVGAVEIRVSSGDPRLDDAARRGLLQWRFAPARRDGVPIDAYLVLWVTFHE